MNPRVSEQRACGKEARLGSVGADRNSNSLFNDFSLADERGIAQFPADCADPALHSLSDLNQIPPVAAL